MKLLVVLGGEGQVLGLEQEVHTNNTSYYFTDKSADIGCVHSVRRFPSLILIRH